LPRVSALTRKVEEHGDRLTNLRHYGGPDVAACRGDTARGHSSKVLALGRGGLVQSVREIGIDHDLRVEPPDRGGEQNDMNDRRGGVEDALGRDQDRGVEEPGLSPLGRSDQDRRRHPRSASSQAVSSSRRGVLSSSPIRS